MEELFKLIAIWFSDGGCRLPPGEAGTYHQELQLKSITLSTIVVARQSGMEMDEINDIINYKKVN